MHDAYIRELLNYLSIPVDCTARCRIIRGGRYSIMGDVLVAGYAKKFKGATRKGAPRFIHRATIHLA